MEIEGTKFGSITIDRKTYEHDVVIRLSGEVIKAHLCQNRDADSRPQTS
jgi:hypothetical protein